LSQNRKSAQKGAKRRQMAEKGARMAEKGARMAPKGVKRRFWNCNTPDKGGVTVVDTLL